MKNSPAIVGLAFGSVLVMLFCVGPFAWQFLTSLRPTADLTSLKLPSRVTLENYQMVFAQADFVRALLNSALVAGTTTLLCLLLAAPAAFAIAKLRFRGRGALLYAALAVSMFPPIATVSPLFIVIRSLGLRDQLPGLVLPYCTFALPLSLWLLTRFFEDVPDALYQAARIDGCSPWGALVRIYVPVSMPAIATTGLLTFITAWNEFLYALTFLSSPHNRTVPVAISLFSGDHVEPWGQIAAASIVATLPLVLVTLVFQRRMVQGLTAGSVKH